MITSLLLLASYIDIKKRIIPDTINIIILIIAIVINKGNIKNNIIPALIIFLITYIVAYITNDGFGGGDIKLLTALALYIGDKIYIITLIAAVTGLIIGLIKKQKNIPFGPYIAFGYIITNILI